MKTIIIPLISLLLFVACDPIELKTADTNVSVVEAYVHPDNLVEVQVKKQFVYNSNDTTIQYLNNLNVSITDGVNTYDLINTDSGRYVSASAILQSGELYTLNFEYNDLAVWAETEIPSRPEGFTISDSIIEAISFDDITMESGTRPEMPDPVDLTYDNPDNAYHLIVVECVEEDLVLINSSTSDRPMRSFRTQPVQGTEFSLNSNQFTYYGQHQVILFKLNAEYAALYEQMETTSLDIEAPPSNVENGLGIFTGVNTDTLFIDVIAQ